MTEAPKRGRKPRPKAVLEGAAAEPLASADVYCNWDTGEITRVVKATTPTFNAGLKHPDPVPGDNGKALARIVAFFKDTHPDEWEKIRLHPLQHGLDDMVALL